MATLPSAPLTEEQYLEIERAAEFKSEFHDGLMFARAASSADHAHLSAKIGALLHRTLPPGCRVFGSDLRVKVEQTGLYTYPDCSVVCGNLELATDQKDVLLNPLLLAEVLSPSTEAYDRGQKFESYRTIPSFREYLLIHQDRRHVEHYSKQDDNSWVLREHSGESAVISITRWSIEIPLADLYANLTDLA